MKLIIKNLGLIKNNTQAIDLSKDFFVFVGRNNSGKSYVAQLLWAIFNQDIINKFALKNLEIIDNEIVENVNKVEVTPELIGKILSRYSNFLQEETKKEIFNTGKEATIFNKIAINEIIPDTVECIWQVGSFQALGEFTVTLYSILE